MSFLYRPISTIPVSVSEAGEVAVCSAPGDVQIRTMTGLQVARLWGAMEHKAWPDLYALAGELLVGLNPGDLDRIPPGVLMGLLNVSSSQSKPGESDLGKSDTPSG